MLDSAADPGIVLGKFGAYLVLLHRRQGDRRVAWKATQHANTQMGGRMGIGDPWQGMLVDPSATLQLALRDGL